MNPARKPHPNYRRWTAEQDAELRACYQPPTRGKLTRFSAASGIPISTLAQRAVHALGLPPTRRARRAVLWSEAEDQLIIDYAYLPGRLLTQRLAAAGFPRSPHSVENRRSVLRRQGRPMGRARHTLTPDEIAVGMRCSEDTICRWIRMGWLKATALTPQCPRNKRYQITYSALRQFCLSYPLALSQLAPDLVWYTDLVGRSLRDG